MAVCNVCFRQCSIEEGKTGYCGARICKDGEVIADNYGIVTSLSLDPIEKKPLARFYPGSRILSAGSFGCNLHCPFCQNHEISWPDGPGNMRDPYLPPEYLVKKAVSMRRRGNIGLAFTYNEPLVGYEYVRDAAKLSHENDMKNVIVTNGSARLHILEEIAPYIDAANIDLKGFTDRYYRDVLNGDRKTVMDFIEAAVRVWHVELTTLIVPGENDSEDEMRRMTEWIAGLSDKEGNVIGTKIPLHITRFFPRYYMTDRDATDISLIYRLAEVASERLEYVYTGNC